MTDNRLGIRVTFTNSLLDDDCNFTGVNPYVSKGGNIESPSSTCGLTDPTDQISVVDPLLGPLTDNGGPTKTHALLPGSPAINKAVKSNCPVTDQRSALRDDAVCDVGAFEFDTIGPSFQLVSVSPNHGGDTGIVSVAIRGNKFVPGAVGKLTRPGNPDIVGTTVTVGAGGTRATTTFDLRGQPRGLWNVGLTNPDGTAATLPQSFTIEAGRVAQPWVDVLGRNIVRRGQPRVFNVVYGNSSNVDVYDALLTIKIPSSVRYKISIPAFTSGIPELDKLPSPAGVTIGEETVIPLWVYALPAGASSTLAITLEVPNTSTASSLPITTQLKTTRDSQFSRTGNFADVGDSLSFNTLIAASQERLMTATGKQLTQEQLDGFVQWAGKQTRVTERT
jgi:hypothetical protein